MHFIPKLYKCDRCGHEHMYGDGSANMLHIHGQPICPECFSNFVKASCGVLRCTAVFTKDGVSDYDAAMAEKDGEA